MADETQYDPADKNRDGKITKAEAKAWKKNGQISEADNAAYFGFALSLVEQDSGPEGTGTLAPFLKWANDYMRKSGRVPTGYELEQQKKKLGPNSWWNKWDANQRAAMLAEAQDPTSYKASLQQHEANINAMAGTMGVPLPEGEVANIARLARLNNWTPEQTKTKLGTYLQTAAASGADLQGAAGDAQTELASWASRNGVPLSTQAAAKFIEKIAMGRQSVDDAKAEIRKLYMGGAFPAYRDMIDQGYDPEVIANPYMERAQKMTGRTYSLNDQLIQRAMQGIGADGKPAQVPLYEFDRMVRATDDWKNSEDGMTTYSNVADDLLRMFGFR